MAGSVGRRTHATQRARKRLNRKANAVRHDGNQSAMAVGDGRKAARAEAEYKPKNAPQEKKDE